MNIFQEAKQILDKDGKVNALGPYGKGKLTGREVSAYFRRNKVSDPEIKKAVEVALDMGGAYDIAGKEIQKHYGRKIRNSKEVVSALQYANEETFRDDLNDLEEGQFWGQDKMVKAINKKEKKTHVRLVRNKGGHEQATIPKKDKKKIAQMKKDGFKEVPIESVKEGKYPMPSSTKEKKAFDALYKKMDGGPEHMAIKKKIKNQVKADDAFHSLVMKRVMSEAFSKTPKSGAEVAKMMMKSDTMKGFANKVKKMKTVTAVQLDKMLPDYVSGGDIHAMFEEITEGKLGDSIIRKDFPNVWAASAKDRTILKKFHAKVDTSNYKKQKEIYNKNIKSFMSGLNNEKLSSIMKKMTVKKGPMKGWMTDSVIHDVAQDIEGLQESKMGDLLIDIQMGATAKELARDHEITIQMAKNFLADYYGAKNKPRKAPGLKKESKEDTTTFAGEEQTKPFFDTYKDMVQEEVANITVDKQNKISKVSDQNAKAMLVHDAAKRMGLKSSMVGKNIRVKGNKKKIHDFMMVVIGKSSYGDPTEQDTSTPQIDKMLNKSLK